MTDLAHNRKASFNYEFLRELEAGIELVGHEVKAIRAGKATLEGAHVTVRGNEAFLVGASIAPYQPNNAPTDYEALRTKKLLLTHKEIGELSDTERQRGLTIVPISLYNKNGKIKVRLAIARGKKKFDKREALKRREADREMLRTLKTEY